MDNQALEERIQSAYNEVEQMCDDAPAKEEYENARAHLFEAFSVLFRKSPTSIFGGSENRG